MVFLMYDILPLKYCKISNFLFRYRAERVSLVIHFDSGLLGLIKTWKNSFSKDIHP